MRNELSQLKERTPLRKKSDTRPTDSSPEASSKEAQAGLPPLPDVVLASPPPCLLTETQWQGRRACPPQAKPPQLTQVLELFMYGISVNPMGSVLVIDLLIPPPLTVGQLYFITSPS